jgi:hypothetical protein
MTTLNAFTMARPRGPDLDIPAVPPRKSKRGKELTASNVQQALGANGRPVVGMQPRTQGGIALK